MESMTMQKPDVARKSILKRCLTIFLVLALLTAAIFVLTRNITGNREKKVMSYLDGKTFILEMYTSNSLKKDQKLLSFKDGKVSVEHWEHDKVEPSENINDYTACRIKASIFDKEISIKKNYEYGWSTILLVVLCDDGTVVNHTYSENEPRWRECSKEELDDMRTIYFCGGHNFSQWKEITPSTCSHAGEQERVCSKCGYTEIQYIPTKDHNYKNKICTECGEKKPVEKSDLEANTWYTYDSVLHIQNCLVKFATSVSQGRAMMVDYYAVCQHCHAIDETLKSAVPEVNYEVTKIHTCSECKGQTLVRLKID